MKSPKDMRIIQIDITNACPHKCSNCTRFCGHHQKPFFMDFDTFKRAVDSLIGFQGTIGVMGGEPTLHPEFERFVRYLDSKLPEDDRKKKNNFIYPQDRFIESIRDQELENTIPSQYCGGTQNVVRGAGLWSAMGESYKRHYEIIQDIFKYQAVNDHVNAMYHQPALISRKDLGIPDEEWLKLRDKCWINQLWSATITPKGAFFCEVAGALDMLFDGPGGWPIEPGWWQREEKDFGEQLQWCEICGLALNTFTRDAREEIDDVSSTLLEKLKEINSPKYKQGKINLIKVEDGHIAEESKADGKQAYSAIRYADSYESRFNATDTVLYPKEFVGVIFAEKENEASVVVDAINRNLKLFTRIYLVVDSEQLAESYRELLGREGMVQLVIRKTFGQAVNYLLQQISNGDYIVLFSEEVIFSEDFSQKLKKCIINPGTMHYIDFTRDIREKNDYIVNAYKLNQGYVALFNSRALSLRQIGYDGIGQCLNIADLVNKWISEKVVELSNAMDYQIPEIHLVKGTRYAIYGAGTRARWVIKRLQEIEQEPIMIVDSNEKKWNTVIQKYKVENPESLLLHMDKYDKVIIASSYYYGEIKEKLISMGIAVNKISMGER